MLIKQSALLNLSVEKWSLILCILPQKQSHEQEQGMMRLNLSKFASSPQDKRKGDHALKEHKSSASLHCWAEREKTLVYYFYPKWKCFTKMIFHICGHIRHWGIAIIWVVWDAWSGKALQALGRCNTKFVTKMVPWDMPCHCYWSISESPG